MNTLTFGLAVAGYAMLCGDVMLHAARRPSRALTVALAVVVATHVALVWGWRFGWSPSVAIDKGVAGFVVFHAALAAIVGAALAAEPWSGRLIHAAFAVTTVGAVGAAFTYDPIAWTRVPVVLSFAITVLVLLRLWRRR